MKALLILSHGSRREESNLEIIAFSKKIGKEISDHFGRVVCAFLQFASPVFDTQVAGLIDQGATEIVVFPYFISAGRHVLSDIPELIRKAEIRHPGIKFSLLDHLGKLDGVKALIVKEVNASSHR